MLIIGSGPAYDPASWESFAVAEVGASAALIAFSGVAYGFQALGGLYWLAPGILPAFIVGLGNSWVAIIEILR